MNPTRRDFLRAGVALSLAPAAQIARAFAPEEAFSFAFFSDTHVGLKSNIEQNAKMLAEISAWKPDFAINGGDVTDYGWAEEYRNYLSLIDPLGFKIHHNPGNHDVRWSPLGPKAFKEGTRGPLYQSFDHNGVHFVILDSTVPLSHYGHFESEQLRWLADDLAKVGRETPVILCTHHWVGREKMVVGNESALMRVIEPYNIKLIFNGHGHSDLLWTWDGIVSTMNKGLYQFSWQRIDVNSTEIKLHRRSEKSPEPKLISTIPIKSSKEKRKVYALGEPNTELRIGEGTWKPNTADSIAGLIAGDHQFLLRSSPNTYHSGPEIKVGKPDEAWRRQLPGGVMSHLRVHDDYVYVSCMDGSILCFNLDGKQVWKAKTDGYCHSSPAVDAETLLVGSADTFVYSFNAKSGKQLWKFATNGPVYSSPIILNDLAVAASGDGIVYGINLKSDKEVWRYELPRSQTSFIQSPLATDGEIVFCGAWDKFLYAINAMDGRLVWKAQCTEKSFAYSPAIGQPVVDGNRVFVPSNDNQLHAFDCKTGSILWKATAPGDKFGYPSPAVDRGVIYSGGLGGNGDVYALSVRTGTLLWRTSVGQAIYDSGIALGDEFLAIGSVSGMLSILDRKGGKVLHQRQLPPGLFLSTCAISGKRILAATYNDTLIAINLRTG